MTNNLKMRILFFLVFVNLGLLNAQDEFFIGANLGVSTTYLIKGDVPFYNYPDDEVFFNRSMWWNKKFYQNIGLGIHFKSAEFKFFKKSKYLKTNLFVNYQPTNFENYLEGLFLTNEIYFPKQKNDKKINYSFGLRNSYLLIRYSEFTSLDSIVYVDKKYFLGISNLFEYRLTEKINLGLNIYTDITSRLKVRNHFSYRNFEFNANVFYKIH